MAENNNTNGISIKALITASVTALLLGFGGYLAGGVNRADEARAQAEVLKVEIRGELALIRADQERMRQDITAIKAAVQSPYQAKGER